MKYCKNCGMLLEDSIEQCIKCGTDVSIPSNVSFYPPEVEARMKEKKAEDKNKTTLVIVLIAVFVVLALLIGVMVWKASTGELRSREDVKTVAEVIEEPVEASPVPETEPVQDVAEPLSDREIKDENGSYYMCAPQSDAAGNHIFNFIYPEDINTVDFLNDTQRYSAQFPMVMSAVATNEDNSVRFTYMSPQQIWHQKSEKGRSRTNERIPQYFMSYYAIDDAQSYLEALIKQYYPKAKKIELVNKSEASEGVVSAVQSLSKQRQDYFLNEKIGDYAHLGEDAEYATMGASCSAEVFEYQITDAGKDVMYCKYFVPVISNDLMYSTEIGSDMGTITEWYILCVCGFEAGNDFDYEDYAPAFDLFCANALPTREFFYLNSRYQEDINKSIEEGVEPEFISDDKLKMYGAQYKSDSQIGELNEEIYSFLSAYGTRVFSSDNMTIHAADDIAVAFYDKESNKLFVSPDETEYPGDSYEELLLQQ